MTKLTVQYDSHFDCWTGTFSPDCANGLIHCAKDAPTELLWFHIGAFCATWGRGTRFEDVTVVRPDDIANYTFVPPTTGKPKQPVRRRTTEPQRIDEAEAITLDDANH